MENIQPKTREDLKDPPRRRKYHEIIHECLKNGSAEYKDIKEAYLKKYKKYGDSGDEQSMHKAMHDISCALKEKGLTLIMKGNNRNGYKYSYPDGGADVIKEWLIEQSRARKKMRQAKLIELFAKSKGLLPGSWIIKLDPIITEIFKEETKHKIIEFDSNHNLKNIIQVPAFFDAIEKEKVITFEYNAGYKHTMSIVFNPYYIKEYNNRFFCIGLKIENNGNNINDYIIAVDRVESEVEEIDKPYIFPQKDYSLFFEDIVGVTHITNKETGQPIAKQEIVIETMDIYTHGRIISKPLHPSQKEDEKFVTDENGKDGRGRISINVAPNNELISLLLGFGSNIKVISPKDVVEQIANNAKRIAAMYE